MSWILFVSFSAWYPIRLWCIRGIAWCLQEIVFLLKDITTTLAQEGKRNKMPKAVVSGATEKFELKSLEGGEVTLRRLTYGQKLERIEMSTKQVIKQSGGRRNNDNAEMDIRMLQRLVAEYEFKNCVVDHNLEDETGQKLNFSHSTTLDKLDPRVGDEISTLISSMNNFDEESEGN